MFLWFELYSFINMFLGREKFQDVLGLEHRLALNINVFPSEPNLHPLDSGNQA
jgi:hypothetical protein